MQKSIWIFGVLAGTLSAILEYLFFSSEVASSNVMYVSKVSVLAICVIFGLILLKKLSGGIISLSRVVFSGALISLVSAVIMIIVFLFLYSPNGEFYEEHKLQAFEQAAKRVAAEESIKPADKPMELEEIKTQIASLYKPAVYSLSTVGSNLTTGLIISILMAAFIGTNMMYTEND